MSFFKWSTTASSNATADSTINWAEGQAPSTVNDSARALMAAAAKFRKDIGGVTTAGSSTAYTITSNQVFDTLANLSGNLITIVPHTTSGAAPTLNVDSLGAKAINISTGVAVPTGALIVGTPYAVVYFNASTEFILLNAQGAAAFSGSVSASSSSSDFVGFEAIGTNAGAGVGATIKGYHNSASPANGDIPVTYDFAANDSGGNKTTIARVGTIWTDVTNGSEDADIYLQAIVNGALATKLRSSVAGGDLTGDWTISGILNGATAAGAMLATQAQQETGTATNLLIAPGTQHFNPRHPKADGIFNGTGTPAFVSGVGTGFSSVTDNGTGDYTPTMSTALSSADYLKEVSTGANTGISILYALDRTAAGSQSDPTTTAFRVTTFQTTFSVNDTPRVSVAVLGDFA